MPTSPDEPQPPIAPEPSTADVGRDARPTPVAPTPTPGEPVPTSAEPVAASPVASNDRRPSLGADHRLTLTWQVIGAIAVIVGLLTGVITLLDRFAASPPPVVTPAPTRPHITVDASSPRGASELIAFLRANSDGAPVELDISCYETVAKPACLLETSPMVVPDGSTSYMLVWLFGDEPCFEPMEVGVPRDPDYTLCTESSVMWVDPRVGDAPVVLGNIQGAGTMAIRGTWVIRAPMGAAFYPANIHGYRVTPFGITTPVEGPTPGT
ncbi:MAG: hypothetical protein KF809_14430 [Chloroflexi bacterium]|nr:hypothetical protein [Chloroflexota bacterium]